MGGVYKQGITLWFTGLSGSGKTTLCNKLKDILLSGGFRVEVLDGNEVRRYLGKDLGFSRADRDENIRRIAFVADLLTRNGVIVLVSAISPYRQTRDEARQKIKDFAEVYVNAPLAVCEQRDVKGLYKKARAGLINNFTGIDDVYEPPLKPEVECYTNKETVEQSIEKVIAFLETTPLLCRKLRRRVTREIVEVENRGQG